MTDTAALLDRVVADLDQVLSTDALAGLPDAERMTVLRTAGDAFRRVEAVIVETVAGAEPRFSDGRGCRSMNELLQRAVRVDAPGAAKIAKAADAVRRDVSLTSGERLPARYPAFREAMLDGVIGVAGLLAAITPIDQAGHRIGVEGRLRADAALADYARGCRRAAETGDTADGSDDADADGDAADRDAADVADDGDSAPPATPDDVRQFAQVIAMALDPDGPEPTDHHAQHQRFVSIGRLRNGVHSLRGNLLPDAAAQLQLLIDAQCNPKTGGPPMPGVSFRPTDESDEAGNVDEAGTESRRTDEDPFNSDPRNVIDPRTAAQKRHDALAAALGIAARHEDMPSLGGAAPTLVVHVDANDVATGSGWAAVAGSEAPLPATFAAHTACTGAIQRILFDDVPASWCEIHHVTEHARGGPTHTDNGVPLCWWHHRSLDWSGWEIRMADGLPQIRGPEWWDREQRWRTPRPSIPPALRRAG